MNKVQQGQSFLDMILQQTAEFESIIDGALLNDMSLTDDLGIGNKVNVTTSSEKIMLQYQNRRPATALKVKQETLEGLSGIGYLEIGKTFIVS